MTADIGNLQIRKMFKKSLTKTNAKQLDVQPNLSPRQSGFHCKDSLLIRRRPKVPDSSRSSSFVSSTNSDDTLYEPTYDRKPIKSILKIHCANATDNSNTRTKQKKVVTFGSKKIRNIEPFLPYAADMWWSKAETSAHKKNQSDFSNATAVEKELARKYLKGVYRGRSKLRKMQEESIPNQSSPNDLLVLKDSYQQLLEGRIYGLAGLETYMNGHSEVRQSMFKIVERYHSFVHSPQQNDDSDTDFYSYVRSVTAADRAWAEILGRVDAEAAQNNPADLV